MRSHYAIRVAGLCALVALSAAAMPHPVSAQAQQVSLGEAARRLRAQQKPMARTPKVWTNDDVPKLPSFGVNVVGPPPESLTESKEAPGQKAGAAPASAGGAANEIKDAEAELAKEKAHLDLVSRELDLFKRELALDQQQFYSNPGYKDDVQGKARLDSESAQIAAKQQEVQQAKNTVAELEAKLTKLKAAPPSTSAPQ